MSKHLNSPAAAISQILALYSDQGGETHCTKQCFLEQVDQDTHWRCGVPENLEKFIVRIWMGANIGGVMWVCLALSPTRKTMASYFRILHEELEINSDARRGEISVNLEEYLIISIHCTYWHRAGDWVGVSAAVSWFVWISKITNSLHDMFNFRIPQETVLKWPLTRPPGPLVHFNAIK